MAEVDLGRVSNVIASNTNGKIILDYGGIKEVVFYLRTSSEQHTVKLPFSYANDSYNISVTSYGNIPLKMSVFNQTTNSFDVTAERGDIGVMVRCIGVV
ncbi:hypothetical protein [Pseudomonas sp.]|uniref:hypothetical protein n=1 Tax=Pseudomonas sp. TaxID=306 RepID=UPI003FD6D4CC